MTSAANIAAIFSPYTKASPFIKWAGGKSSLLPTILPLIPDDITSYAEPFLGGGAVFYGAYNKLGPFISYSLSDLNADLIDTYRQIKTDALGIYQILFSLKNLHDATGGEEVYYTLRNADRCKEFIYFDEKQKAARFIYLNKNCFNGLYRVNSRNQFNVGWNKETVASVPSIEQLKQVASVLSNPQVQLYTHSFTEGDVQDFVYFDPPYASVSSTSNFTQYTCDGFTLQDQQDLYNYCVELDLRGKRFLLSNSKHPKIIDLYYKQFDIQYVEAPRNINSKGHRRGKVKEVLIKNY